MVLPDAPLLVVVAWSPVLAAVLGAALALDLLDQGATVVALSRQQCELQQLACLCIGTRLRNNLLLEAGSTLDPQCTSSAIAQLAAQGCELNLLVANASVFGPRELLMNPRRRLGKMLLPPMCWVSAAVSVLQSLPCNRHRMPKFL